mmetsp:Transcript_41191/g.106299  ORF Transcript_41191/g.106299 Transcript_41191/m.106299 type:complete len:371 (+) Transcript_41191:231-1343(+)
MEQTTIIGPNFQHAQDRAEPKAGSQTRVSEAAGPRLDLLPQRLDVGVARKAQLEVLEFLAFLLLHLQGNLEAPVQEPRDLLEVLRGGAARRHGRGADAHAAGGQRGDIAGHGVAIQSDGAEIADLLELGAREAVRPQVPEHQVVVRAVARELVALGLQGLAQGVGVGHDVLGVLLELRAGDLQELSRQAADLVVVRAALQAGEDRHVDALLDVGDLLGVLEEDHACTRATQRLVRGGRDHVAMLEGRRVLARGNQARDVRDVSHEQGSDLVGDLPELLEVHDPRVGGGTAQDHGRAEDQGRLAQLLEVDEPGLVVHLVRQRLEVDGRRRDSLLRSVVTMRQVAAAGQVQAHDAGMGRQQRRVHREVRGAA